MVKKDRSRAGSMKSPASAPSRMLAVEGVGTVRCAKSGRARCLRLTVRASRGVHVSIPARVSYDEAEKFVLARRDWIRWTQRRIAHARERYRSAVEAAGRLDIREARKYLASRLDALAAEHGFTYKRLSVRMQRTLWGSASAAGRVQLNAFLAVLPQELTDYVILHELTHTRVNGHGRAFWRELESHIPDVHRRRALLRDYALALF